MLKRNLFLVLIGVFLAGCSTVYNAATGHNEFIMVSTPEEVSMGKSAHQGVPQANTLSTDQTVISRINTIGQRLARFSDRQDYPYNFYVIEQDDLNAFTVPGGNVYIYSGLVKKLKTDDQIASVLAHEIGHCAARHTIKKFQAALGYNLIGGLVLSALQVDSGTKQLAAMGSNTVMGLVFSAYGRQDEYQADQLGVKYMALAGYDPRGSIEALEVLRNEMKNDRKVPLILRSHPYLEDRIEQVKKEIINLRVKYVKPS